MRRKIPFLSLLILSLFLFCGSAPSEAAKLQDPASPKIAARIFATSAMVAGTYDAQDRANFSLIDRGGIATSKPQTHIALCLRRTSYTYKNVMLKRSLTLNLPSQEQAAEVDLFGSFSGLTKDSNSNDVYQDKVAITGLAVDRGSAVSAPMLRAFPVSLECELVSNESLDEKSPFDLLIVKVVKVWADERYINDASHINPKPAGHPGIMFYVPGAGENYGYYALGQYFGKPETLGEHYMENLVVEGGNSASSSESSSGSGGCNSGLFALPLLGGLLAVFAATRKKTL